MDVAPPPRFHLSLLGRFKLSGPEGVVDLPSKKLAGLLTYLACTSPQPQRRETLAALLWGSHFDLQAKQNLRQALFRVRKALGHDALAGEGEIISLNRAVVLCDVSRFEALLRDGSRDALSAAADLYLGRLVDDVVITEEGWSEWLEGERKRLLDLTLGALLRLGEQELAVGRAEEALKAGQRAIALNSMREDAHRLIIRALAAAGRGAKALTHYQNLVVLLKRELNAEPDAATRSLAAELRSAQPPTVKEITAPRLDVSQDAKHALNAEKPAAPGDAASSSPPARSAGPERRQLTIMACTMVGAPLSANLDPEDLRDRIGAFRKMVADAVVRFDGFVAQYLADGVLVYFGYPAAREHDAEQAVRAGLEIVDLVGTLKTGFDLPPQARVGIATGLVVIGEQVGTGETGQRIAIGEAPNLAVQLQAVAAPGGVVIAGSTRRLAGRTFDCRALAADEPDGRPPSVEAWEVRGEMAGISRFEARRAATLSPLVGRQEEMELLLRRWDQAKLGEGRVVLLSGEPGIGKSRIAEDLQARLEGEPHARLRYFCSPHHTHSPLHPSIAQLERAAKFEPGSGAGAKLDKLETLLKPMARNVPRDLALIADLLSVPTEGRYPLLAVNPQQQREMTLTALLDQLDGLARNGPVLIVFEDIHWIDPTSLDLLDRTVARSASLPVLMLVTFRPEVEPSWLGQPHVTMRTLTRLGRRDSTAIIGSIAKGKGLPDAVVEQVLDRTDGVPLFIEELTSSLLESGALRETGDGYALDRPLPALAVPTTLQDSLVARLDRLGSTKDVAQMGAAIGREFSYELLGAVSSLAPTDLDAALERLTSAGLISRRGAPPMSTYSFKHALVQDAAYATMLRGRRQPLHARIAEALIERFPEMAESQPELVAQHFAEAGLASEAIGYWRRAGQLASARSANREAVTSFERAVHLLETQPETRERLALAIDLRFDLRTVLFQLGEGFDRILAYLREAEGLARKLGDQRRLGQLSVHLCHIRVMAGHPLEAIGFGENAQAIAESLGDVQLQVTANLELGVAYHFAADYRREEELLRKVLGLLEGDRWRERFGQTVFPAVAARGYLTWTFSDRGRFEEAVAYGREGLRIAEALDHPYSLAYATWTGARPHIVRGDFSEAVRLLERGVALSRERNLIFLTVLNTMGLGYAYALSGRTDEAIALLKQALRGDEAAREQAVLPLCLIFLGEAYVLAERPDDALPLLARALSLAREHHQGGYEAPALRLLGEIAARRDDPEQAEGHYGHALAFAEKIDARPLAAHCHLGLGKLYRRTRRRKQAQQHLTTAMTMYGELDMPFWLEQGEAEVREPQ